MKADLKQTIVILEDDPSVLMPIVDLLEAEGFDVESAQDGLSGLELIGETLPDLIVSDIMMPVMDGLEVFEKLQEDPHTSVIPFIFLTAKTDPKDIRKGLSLGADDYLTKPFEPEDLLNAIRVRLNKYKTISDAALTVTGREDLDQIFIKDGESCWLVELEKIILLESEGNYVRVQFEDNKPLISKTLTSFEERLPKKQFFRANRKQMINLKWIRNIQPWFGTSLLVTLKDGTKVKMSRRASKVFRSMMGI